MHLIVLSAFVVLTLCAVPAEAQSQGAGPRGLTADDIRRSEALAPKFDEAAKKEQARLKTFANRPIGGMIQRSFNVFANYLVVAAEMMPESAYGFRMTPDLRTFGEQINHATTTHYSLCHQAGLPPGVQKETAPDLRPVTTKAAIVKALRDSIAYCDRILAAASEEWLSEVVPELGGSSSGRIRAMRAHSFIYNAVHSAEDYGTITTYMRAQGYVPPSTALHPPAP